MEMNKIHKMMTEWCDHNCKENADSEYLYILKLKHVCHFFHQEQISGGGEEHAGSNVDHDPNPDDGHMRLKLDRNYRQ